ncbi:MAG: hypothetical protein H6774_00430 [Pseudomonadales bacterium]|nr:hypothetical protein [Candidatus Woesebacteria bacterium]MCB9801538.1 hypothetical protein [Pseudomonadales bacterium]
MYDVITIGSSLIDVFVQSSHFTVVPDGTQEFLCQLYGDKMEVDSFQMCTGGGGSNTAVAFARSGFHTGVVTETGRDSLADIIVKDFHDEVVATRFLVGERKEQTGGSVILVGADGGRTVLVHRGAASRLDPHDIPTDALNKSMWVHLSSISGNADTLYEIFSVTKQTTAFSWNPGKAELALLAGGQLSIEDTGCQILCVNAQEWEQIKNVQTAILEFVPEVIVTNGKHGGMFFVETHQYSFSTNDTQSIDDTGAGDAFISGYVAARLYGEDVRDAVDAGLDNAESVIGYVGAKHGLLTRSV